MIKTDNHEKLVNSSPAYRYNVYANYGVLLAYPGQTDISIFYYINKVY